MSRDDSRLASLLGELAELGRRISDRAAELAGLVDDENARVPPGLADRLAEVTASTADLAAAAAGATAAAEPPPPQASTAATAPAPRARAAEARPRSVRKPSPPRPRRKQPRPAASATSTRPIASEGRRQLRPFMPAVVSAAVNVAAILGLALFFVAAEAKPRRPVLTLGGADEPFVEELNPVEFEASEEPAEESEPAEDALPELAATAATDDRQRIDGRERRGHDRGGDEGTSGSGGRGGGAAGGGQPGGGSFFGRTGQGQSVCFICDNSNSYRDGGFHAVLDELARAVESLRPEQSFFVIFFSDAAYPLLHPDRVETLQPATPENKQRLRAWLATVEMCGGGQGIDEAVRLAQRAGAEVVYFLSDGEHAASVVDRVASADFGGAAVHTFGMQQGVLDRQTGQLDPEKLRRQQGFNQNLVAIATAHGGTFTPVTVPPQAAVLERLRPIRRNRAPGPVWGLKL